MFKDLNINRVQLFASSKRRYSLLRPGDFSLFGFPFSALDMEWVRNKHYLVSFLLSEILVLYGKLIIRKEPDFMNFIFTKCSLLSVGP